MKSDKYDSQSVIEIVRKLRSKGGCPWDNKQTYQSLRKYFLEEVYEALDAIDRGDYAKLCEELGDCIWEIIFIARIAEQDGHFKIDDVYQMLGEKMVRRHPHIFGDGKKLENPDQVLEQWAQIKLKEGKTKRTGDILKKVPASLPALLRAYRVGERVSKVGFDWETPDQVMDKFHEEMAEFNSALKSGSKKKMEQELGDVLFTLVNLSRHLEISPEDALRGSTEKFIKRFAQVEKQAQESGEELLEMDVARLEAMWQSSKKKVG